MTPLATPQKKKSGKAKKSQKGMPTKPSSLEENQLRRGMPAVDSVRSIVHFVSPQKVKYRILKTTETDAYDPPLATQPKQSKKKS